MDVTTAMRALGASDLRRLLALSHQLADDDPEVAPGLVLRSATAMLGADFCGYVVLDHASKQLVAGQTAPGGVCFGRFFSSRPLFPSFRDRRAQITAPAALTDLLDKRQLRDSPLYTDFLRHHGTRDQLIDELRPGTGTSVFMSVNRDRSGFSQRDRSLTRVLSGSLRQALRRRERQPAVEAAQRRIVDAVRAAPRLASLTPREQQVVAHLAGGATNREIARSLAISERTVHKHLEQTYRKLGVTNRTGVLALLAAATE
jgi:DNA-binding CsgD family transcriptional regulator